MNRLSNTSQLLAAAVEELSMLPGIGAKSALRFALFLLDQPLENVERFGSAILKMRREITNCPICNNITDTPICSICTDGKRDSTTICLVESFRDLISIENTGEYNGVYHVLGGLISPMDGVSPSNLSIQTLVERVEKGDIKEVIMALSTTIEGETTAFFIYRKLIPFDIKVSTIARGVGFGDNLEYTDQLTLGRSIARRQPFNP
ncbi:MAG: recombination mediator RecR [Bacteroidales bacterium]